MKKLFVILVVSFFTGFNFYCEAQTIDNLQKTIDSLNLLKSRLVQKIERSKDSINLLEIEIGNLIRKKINAATIEQEQSSINSLLGIKGISVALFKSDTLWDNPNSSNKYLMLIASGEKVTVLALEKYPFYKIKYKKKIGLLNCRYLLFSSEINRKNELIKNTISGHILPLGQSQENISNPVSTKSNLASPSSSSNTQYRNTSSEKCGSSQCIGTTQKGSRCKNRTTNCNGRCHLH